MTALSIIVAYNKKKCIGKDNKLLFKDKEDLKRFKEITDDHPIIMGRKTHESIGRILPNRTNIIVSRNKDYVPLGLPAYTVMSLAGALLIASNVVEDTGADEIFFIGGGDIYKQALNFCDKMYVSEFNNDLDGDIFFPEYDVSQWKEVAAAHLESHTFKLLERVSEEKSNQRKDKDFEKS